MSIKLHWFLPTTGDARSLVGGGHSVPQGVGRPADGLGTANHFREADIDYLAMVARTAEQLGFEGVLTPTGTWCEDAWLATAALIRETRNLKFLVAFRPGVTSPTLSAQMAAAFQRISDGRLLLNVVTGGEPTEQRRFGDHLVHGRALRPHRRVPLGGARRVDQGAVRLRRRALPGRGRPGPRHDRPGAGDLLRRLLGPGRPGRGQARRRLPHLGRAARAGRGEDRLDPRAGQAEQGRDIRFGLRIHTLSRDTSERRGRRRSGCSTGSTRPRSRRRRRRWPPASRSASSGCARCTAAARRSPTRTSWRSPRTCGPASGWSAAAPAPRWSAATRRSPTGSRSTTALGIDEFILSGYPHVEEAYWFAEGVKPILRAKGIYGDDVQPAATGLGLTNVLSARADACGSDGRIAADRHVRRWMSAGRPRSVHEREPCR